MYLYKLRQLRDVYLRIPIKTYVVTNHISQTYVQDN